MVLFDEAVYSFFISDYQEQEEHEQKIQEEMRAAVDRLQYISEYNITAVTETATINKHNTSKCILKSIQYSQSGHREQSSLYL